MYIHTSFTISVLHINTFSGLGIFSFHLGVMRLDHVR